MKQFDVENCTEEELAAHVRAVYRHNIEIKIERAKKHFILVLPHAEIDVNPRASEQERRRMKKKLEGFKPPE